MHIKKFLNSIKYNFLAIDILYEKMHEIKVKQRKKLKDDAFARIYYKDKTGRQLNLVNPKSFDEKQWWLKFHYRNPLQTICADKYSVRKYVEETVGDEILNDLFAVYDTAESINLDTLPDSFFIKTNHGCGSNYWCHDKKNFPLKKVQKELEKNLKENYYHESREWPYKDIIPKILVEEVLIPHNPPELIDYRFLCFSGRCEYLFVDVDTCADDGHHRPDARRNVYDRDGQYLDIKVTREQFPVERVSIPDNFIQMRDIAEKLATPFPFVRVDLYSFDGMIRFGEMTFFHAGGVSNIIPEEFQITLGSLIKLPNGEYVV